MFLSDIQYFLFVIRSCGQQIGQGWQLLEVSHKPVQGSTAAIARKRRDLAEQSVECGAVMAEMARRAHFTPPSEWLQISCTALLIRNTFETSFYDHTYGAQRKVTKNQGQSMSKSTELTWELTNVFLSSNFPIINKYVLSKM